eukprot:2236805-Pyramimonas_sp.AAC.1
MGTRCVIMFVARYPPCTLAMAITSIGSGPPGVGTPCPVRARILHGPSPEPAADSAAWTWDALASAMRIVGAVPCPSSGM